MQISLIRRPVRASSIRMRIACSSITGVEVWAIRETDAAGGSVRRDICAVPLDGSAAEDGSLTRSIVAGSQFLAHPRISPDGRRLAWLAWDHPQMPWDGTELRLAEFGPDGTCGPWRRLLGGAAEALLQPEWLDATTLTVISDRSGWWNLYRLSVEGGGEPEPLRPLNQDLGGPLWELGSRWYSPLDDGRLLTVRTLGVDTLEVVNPSSGATAELDTGFLSTIRLADVRANRVLVVAGGAKVDSGLRIVELASGCIEDVQLSVDRFPEPAYLPEGRLMTFSSVDGREVHTIVYPPTNPDYRSTCPADNPRGPLDFIENINYMITVTAR